MIELFEGCVGGGKTYFSTVRMVEHMSRGGTVFTNVDMKFDGPKNADGCPVGIADLCKVDRYCRGGGFHMQPEQLVSIEQNDMSAFHDVIQWGTDEIPVLLILDEIHLWFNARNWAKASEELLAFLTQSRKCSVDIIFISQHRDNVDVQFRRLLQYVWTFSDSERFKLPGIGAPWRNTIIANCWFRSGKNLMERKYIRKDRRVFACYSSKAIVGGGVACKNGVADLVRIKRVERPKKKSAISLREVLTFSVWSLVIAAKVYLF